MPRVGLLTIVPQLAVLAERVDDLHHVPRHKRGADEVGILEVLGAYLVKGARVFPELVQRVIGGVGDDGGGVLELEFRPRVLGLEAGEG